jgi:hypothetical protein
MLSAIQAVYASGFVHNSISLSSIRVSETGDLKLDGFKNASRFRPNSYPNTDLEGLATVIVQSINRNPNLSLRDIKGCFFLEREKYWSSYSYLTGFIESCLDRKREAHLKLKDSVSHLPVQKTMLNTENLSSRFWKRKYLTERCTI